MKVLIVSDTHGNKFKEELLVKEKDVDIFLHAGDSLFYEYDLYPFISVKGNCDHYLEFNELYSFKTPYGRLLMRHIPFTLSEIEKYEKEGFKIFVHGHTHIRKAEQLEKGVYIFNPGSLFYPRDGKPGSYLILEINEKEIKHEFKSC